ncbi:MAG: hypothetical protein HEQ37_18795 [Acidovorax sp.]|nr:hypothetical protein [Acidovorax sp.]
MPDASQLHVEQALHRQAWADSLPAQPALPGEHAQAHARGLRRAGAGLLRARCGCDVRRYVGERDAFGSPTFSVGGEIHVGKNRLRDMEEQIVHRQTT